MLEPITKTLSLPCAPDRAYAIFLDMSSWWPLDKRSMSLMRAGAPAKSLEVDARVGGQIIETAADDSKILWGTFRALTPGAHVQMDFHMGLPPEQTGQVDVHFKDIGAGQTEVTLIHSNWEGYGDMAEMMIQGYGGSWDLLFVEHYGGACGA